MWAWPGGCRCWRTRCSRSSCLLAAVAVTGAVLAGLDRESLWSSFLITNTAIGLSAAPCGLLITRAKSDNPIGWLFLIMGIAHLLTAGRPRR